PRLEAHGGHAELLHARPQRRVEAERLGGAHPLGCRLLGEERRERPLQGELLLGQLHSTWARIAVSDASSQPLSRANASIAAKSLSQPAPTRPAAIRRTASTCTQASSPSSRPTS